MLLTEHKYLHMGVGKAPLCNSGLSVSHLTEGFETNGSWSVAYTGGSQPYALVRHGIVRTSQPFLHR
jgi:hypothetical protein